ncbi:MAG: translation initiation factor IF-3 [Candidatus Competibacteraceae bacterium]|nr:translation initiation factor IF-3 [Candidatus Competibacteraceae bacterium]
MNNYLEDRNIAANNELRLNEEITGREVRLIDQDGEQAGVVPLVQARRMAEEAELDLVEISPNAKPPVCRIMDYGKFRFEQAKKQSEARKKQKQIQVKEVKFRPGTDEGDYQVKLRNLIRFLSEGDKAKVTLRFRGREMAHQELGVNLLKRVEDDLASLWHWWNNSPRMEGRQMVMTHRARKKRNSPRSRTVQVRPTAWIGARFAAGST